MIEDGNVIFETGVGVEDCVVISEEKEDKEDMSKSKLERIETMENELAVLKEEYKREQIEIEIQV